MLNRQSNVFNELINKILVFDTNVTFLGRFASPNIGLGLGLGLGLG